MAVQADCHSALQTALTQVVDFIDDIDRIHSSSPTPDQTCCPTLDEPIANTTWHTHRCWIIFTVLAAILILLIIFLAFYCGNTIPCV